MRGARALLALGAALAMLGAACGNSGGGSDAGLVDSIQLGWASP